MLTTSTTGQGRMPVNPATTARKTLNLPKALVRRVKTFRHQRELDTESAAIIMLLEAGLEALGSEAEPAPPRKPRGRG